MSWGKYFEGKSVIVTGGARGIGRGICVELHRLGAKVYAISKNPDTLKSLKEECPSIQTIAVDLGDWDKTRAAVEKIEAVDMLVNNAGILSNAGFLDTTKQDFDSVCNVNLKAVINVSQIVAKKMIDAGKAGSIVNISSVAGINAMPNVCTYSILKAGLDHLTKIMALELGPKNIRVNSVNPGPVLTDMLLEAMKNLDINLSDSADMEKMGERTPSPKKIIDVSEIVNSTLFLLSDSAPMITGTILAVDGGFCVS